MDIEITDLEFAQAALTQEEEALAFFESPEAQTLGFGLDPEFLAKKKSEIDKLKKQIANLTT